MGRTHKTLNLKHKYTYRTSRPLKALDFDEGTEKSVVGSGKDKWICVYSADGSKASWKKKTPQLINKLKDKYYNQNKKTHSLSPLKRHDNDHPSASPLSSCSVSKHSSAVSIGMHEEELEKQKEIFEQRISNEEENNLPQEEKKEDEMNTESVVEVGQVILPARRTLRFQLVLDTNDSLKTDNEELDKEIYEKIEMDSVGIQDLFHLDQFKVLKYEFDRENEILTVELEKYDKNDDSETIIQFTDDDLQQFQHLRSDFFVLHKEDCHRSPRFADLDEDIFLNLNLLTQ